MHVLFVFYTPFGQSEQFSESLVFCLQLGIPIGDLPAVLLLLAELDLNAVHLPPNFLNFLGPCQLGRQYLLPHFPHLPIESLYLLLLSHMQILNLQGPLLVSQQRFLECCLGGYVKFVKWVGCADGSPAALQSLRVGALVDFHPILIINSF